MENTFYSHIVVKDSTVRSNTGSVIVGSEDYLSAYFTRFLNIGVINQKYGRTFDGGRVTFSMAFSDSRTLNPPDFPDRLDGVDAVVDIFSKLKVGHRNQSHLLTGGFFNSA